MTIIAQKRDAGSGSLVSCAISHRHPDSKKYPVTVDVFSGMVQATYSSPIPNREAPHGSTRGQVNGFSPRSRKRMIDALCKKSNYTRPLFITLTYTDESLHPTYASRPYKRDIDALCKRVQAQWPDAGHIWRVEYVARKSGIFKGRAVAHFHLIVDGVLDDMADLRRTFRAWWWRVITDGKKFGPSPRVDVQVARSRRHAMYYVSKYVAKETKKNNIADEHQHNSADTGRHWAVGGNWQQTALATIRLTRQEYIDLKRLCARYLKARRSAFARRLKRGSSYRGFSVYGLGGDSVEGLTIGAPTIMRMIDHVVGET